MTEQLIFTDIETNETGITKILDNFISFYVNISMSKYNKI